MLKLTKCVKGLGLWPQNTQGLSLISRREAAKRKRRIRYKCGINEVTFKPFMASSLSAIYSIPGPTKDDVNNFLIPFMSHFLLEWRPRILVA